MMSATGTKRERLLDWIRNGDPNDVPVLLGPGFYTAASYLDKDPGEVTWPEAIKVAHETGTHNIAELHSPSPFHALPFLEDIKMTEVRDELPDGTPRLTSEIETPEGTLRAVQEFPRDKGSYHRRFFVTDEDDFRSFAYFIRRATDEVVKNPAVRDKVEEELQANKSVVGGAFPTSIWLFCPAVELTSSYYMDQQTAIYCLYDKQGLMEELMDCHWAMTQVWLDIAARNGVDLYQYAINGLEWLSPDIYEQYMIPQARRINDFAASQGKLSWIHTCGKLKRLAEMKAYSRMHVSVVESLSLPPTGDIDDLSHTRRNIGNGIATRGGINVEFFYGTDVDALSGRANYVLDSTYGYRHMLGDTNPSYPAYPRENIQAVIDTVKSRGRLFV